MQPLVVVASLLASSAIAAPAKSLAWRPHEFDVVQDLVAKEAQSLRAKQGGEAAPEPSQARLSLAADGKPMLHLARHTSTIDHELANPTLGHYLGVERPAGKEFSTQWSTKPWNEVSGHVDPHSLAWQPAGDLEKTRGKPAAPKAPKAPLVPYSKLLSSEMKDAVVIAESLKSEAGDVEPRAKALRAATAWPSSGIRPDIHRTALAEAESHAASKQASENPYTAMLGESQETSKAAAQSISNPYEAYLASDKEQFYARVHHAEALGEQAEARDGSSHQGFLSDSTYLSLSGN